MCIPVPDDRFSVGVHVEFLLMIVLPWVLIELKDGSVVRSDMEEFVRRMMVKLYHNVKSCLPVIQFQSW
jgi:hypothetical protein